MAGKTYIKTSADTWAKIKKIYLKTGGQTWTAVRKAYIKTGTGAWRKVYDTASNKPFLRNNDFPRIRLNSFRSAGYIEAPPVQMMGPSTGYSNGWPLGAIGTYLYGANADDLSNYVSGNGSNITYTYNWYWNESGNQNDDTEWEGLVNSGSDRDLFQNTSTYLGAGDGYYFDRNFLTFKVNATNSAGTLSASSPQVYIVRQRPTGSITMVDDGNASINTQMSANITYSDNWYNATDTTESYVEWFAVDNLSDSLTTSNRVQIDYLNSYISTGTTTKSATSYHTPTIQNKYYVARLTLNNSNTLPAKYNGSIINVSGFTPNSAFTSQANKTAKTATANGPFNLTNGTKTGRYYDVASSTWRRYVSVDIGQSTSADRYEVQIEGQYEGSQGSYTFSSASWVVLQTLSVAPYVLESSRIGGTLTMPSVSALNYLNYRFTARSRNGTSLNGAAYSNNGTSTSYQYVSAASVAPSAPSISNIATSTDFQGSFVTFTNYMASTGSNEISYYTYSVDNGSNFQQPTNGFINANEGKIYVTAGSTVNLRIRATNLDGETSASSNLLSITAASVPGVPTSVVVKSFNSLQGTIFLTAGANTQSVQGYLEYDSFTTFDYIDGYVNVSANNAGKIQLSGANSATRTYTAGVRPFSGQNLSGGSGAISTITTKVLNGSDNMQVSLGTITRPSDRTISLSWTLSAGAPTHYICRLYNYTSGFLISTKTISSSSTSISFNSSDGVQYSTIYYIAVQPQYQYTSSVTYEDNNYTSGNINSGANVTAPTSTSIVSMARLDNSTVRAYIGSSGGSGPYYQLYWINSSTAPSTTNYDAASTTSTVMEDYSFANGITYYFYIRSSNENLGNTITGGTATSGTYSDYGPTTGAASYTFASPTGGTASVNGSSSVGSTLTLTLGAPSASPSADGVTWVWRVNDGGTGGNSYTGGSILQNGGTTFVIPQYLYGSVSSVGYLIRAEVTWNNGVGSQSANSTSTAVTAAGVAPSGGAVTLTPSGTQMAGTTISANVTAMSGTATITYATTLRKKTGSPPTSKTDGTEVASGTGTGNGVATHVITASEASGTPDQFRAFTTGTNSFGNSVVSSNTVVSTPYVATQYTVTWNANGGTGGTTTTLDAGSAHTAPAVTRSGFTLSNWRNPQTGGDPIFVSAGGTYTPTANITFWAQWTAVTVSAPSGGTATSTPSTGTAGTTTYVGSTSGWSGSPTSYTYSWQYFSQSSFSWVQYSSGTNFSPPAGINSSYPNYGWQLSVGATNSGGTTYATTSITVNNPSAGVTAPGAPTIGSVSGSGSVSWTAPTSGGTVASYEIEFYTASNGSGSGAAGPYYVTGISSSPYQLTSPYGGTGANWARARVLARNSGGASSYSGWAPSETTYA